MSSQAASIVSPQPVTPIRLHHHLPFQNRIRAFTFASYRWPPNNRIKPTPLRYAAYAGR